MQKRSATTKTEIDFLPPFGQPEVVTTGNGAVDVALGATIIGGAVVLLSED